MSKFQDISRQLLKRQEFQDNAQAWAGFARSERFYSIVCCIFILGASKLRVVSILAVTGQDLSVSVTVSPH